MKTFVYMKGIIPTKADILDWFLLGSTNQADDLALISDFRNAMIE